MDTSTPQPSEQDSAPKESCLSQCFKSVLAPGSRSEFAPGDVWWTEFLNKGLDRLSKPDIVKLIKGYCEDEEYLDIYQVCAFDAKTDRLAYRQSFFKAVLCLFIQIPSIVYIIYYLVESSDKSLCNLSYDSTAIFEKLLAFGFSMYLAYYIDDMHANSLYRGMYCVILMSLQNCPYFLEGNWLRLGGYYNNLAGWCAFLGSYIIIFVAKSPLDLVLNSLALFFLVELDDLLVTKFDYWKINKFCESKYDEGNESQPEAWSSEGRPSCFLCCFEIGFLWTLQGILHILRFVAPFYVGICS